VTGTFDNWSGHTHKLDKEGSVFSKTIALPTTGENILYKFVADGEWKHDPTHKIDTDSSGNLNNVITPSDIMPATIQGTGPGATTAALAGQVPLEKPVEDLPGAFPETPAATEVTGEEQAFSVNPIPASAGAGNPVQLAAGEPVPHPSTINAATVTSHVKDDEELKSKDLNETVSVAPIPASAGIGNPITLAPGEPVPLHQTVTDHTLTSNVKLDKESYEKSDAAALNGVPYTSSIDKQAASAVAAAGVGPQTIIPESSIGVGNNASILAGGEPTIQSTGAGSTTADLAGKQPIEPRQEATVIDDKKESSNGGIAGAIAGGVAGLGAAAAGTAALLNKKTKDATGVDAVSKLPESVQKSINDINSGSTSTGAVPAEVKASQAAAHSAPEASANPEAVAEKSAVEKELLAKVPTAEPGTGAAAASDVPTEVLASQKKAHVDSEASANPVAVHEKSDVEKELLAKVHTTEAAGEPAPVVTAATTAVAPATTTTATSTAPTEHVGIAPNVSAHGAPQLGKVGPIAPITLDKSDLPSSTDSAIATTSSPTARNKSTSSTPNKRHSIMERLKGTPSDSNSSTPAPEGAEASGEKKKRLSFFGKLKEKLHK